MLFCFREVAILGLPNIEDFLAARDNLFFILRENFEELTDDYHDATLVFLGVTDEVAAHCAAGSS